MGERDVVARQVAATETAVAQHDAGLDEVLGPLATDRGAGAEQIAVHAHRAPAGDALGMPQPAVSMPGRRAALRGAVALGDVQHRLAALALAAERREGAAPLAPRMLSESLSSSVMRWRQWIGASAPRSAHPASAAADAARM